MSACSGSWHWKVSRLIQGYRPMSIDPRIARAFEAENAFPLEQHLIVLALMGSHSHGTYIPPEEPDAVDDVDLMGFVVPPLPYHIGLPRWEHWRLQQDELDVVIHSLDKAVRLLLKSNPNIVGLLLAAGQRVRPSA